MTPVQERFVQLEKKKETVKLYFQELKEATDALAQELGIGGTFQDLEDGTVFQVVEPDGKFVTFEKISYIRTKREGEKRGTLSIVKAREAGFNV